MFLYFLDISLMYDIFFKKGLFFISIATILSIPLKHFNSFSP